MTRLAITPDYPRHLLPVATLATAWRDAAGERAVLAIGLAAAGALVLAALFALFVVLRRRR